MIRVIIKKSMAMKEGQLSEYCDRLRQARIPGKVTDDLLTTGHAVFKRRDENGEWIETTYTVEEIQDYPKINES